MIYAHLYDNNEDGLNSGVHYWSVKAIRTKFYKEYELRDPDGDADHNMVAECYRTIGVTNIRNTDIVKKGGAEWVSLFNEVENDHGSYLDVLNQADGDLIQR